MTAEKIILGIDPGTQVLGYGLIKVSGGKMELITLGVLMLSKYDDHFLRLKKIFERVVALIDEYHPDELSIEAPFFGKNVQSMLKLGRAQGVAMAAALTRSVPVFEYSPKKIKQSITGNGNASKEQLAAMLINMLGIKGPPEKLDATDALGAAVCHSFQGKLSGSDTKYTGWKSFLTNNPERKK
ncbi:MAG: crossover junction endodeoxyribonuclease RuvC [Bacteroidetes bacterium]|nr:crossover junction endodeoxyribonuclease RuvC [Bacteroidota bacterium]MBU1718929.1 crossover junction endodeoxyribonuclease RuvC [Bacteroidota bacterium]